MATRKKSAAKNSATKTVAKKSRRTTHTARPRRGAGAAAPASAPQVPGAAGQANIRIRMYRIGFGDFFLMTVPGKSGPAHILIDCGVHAANLGTIEQCVEDMAKETGRNL